VDGHEQSCWLGSKEHAAVGTPGGNLIAAGSMAGEIEQMATMKQSRHWNMVDPRGLNWC
jgi:hypothetical protein